MRLIEADTLIEFIENRYDITWENDYEGGIKDACVDILEEICKMPTIEPSPKWIPVTERLPEEDGLYLVTTSKGQVQVHVFNHNGNLEEYWTRCNKAWMSLPEPYREEG